MNTETASYRKVLSVSLPLVLSMAATTVMEFTDRIFLANYSVEAIAAALPEFVIPRIIMGVALGSNWVMENSSISSLEEN